MHFLRSAARTQAKFIKMDSFHGISFVPSRGGKRKRRERERERDVCDRAKGQKTRIARAHVYAAPRDHVRDDAPVIQRQRDGASTRRTTHLPDWLITFCRIQRDDCASARSLETIGGIKKRSRARSTHTHTKVSLSGRHR